MRYFDEVMRNTTWSDGMQAQRAESMKVTISDPRVKRIIFDNRQAAQFVQLEEPVPPHVQSGLMLPFEAFWLEFDLPVHIGYLPDGGAILLRAIAAMPYLAQHDMAAPVFLMAFLSEDIQSQRMTMNLMMRIAYDLTTGRVVAMDPTDPEYVPEIIGELTGWLLTYMMAKGITIAPERLSRQQSRLLARKKLPNPWHVVKVEPRIHDEEETISYSEEGAKHGYRYDVMGHLRFGRHKLADGSYRHTVEWVRPHQRGLRHELYIPKTSKFTGGTRPHPRMKEWFREAAP